MHGITFNGIKKPYLVTLRGKNRPAWAPMQRNLLEVQGKPGAYYEGTDIKPRVLSVPVLIESDSLDHLKDLKEDLAAWLVTDGPRELVFDDEPDRVYFAMVRDTFELQEVIRVGVGMIEFICPDPYVYGKVENLKPTATDLNKPIILSNNGTVETPPVFTIDLKERTTFVDVVAGDDYMRLGRAVDEDSYAAPSRTAILKASMDNFTGWVDEKNFTLDHVDLNYKPTGTMVSNGYSWGVTDTGVGKKWHGPAKIATLSETLTDFELEYRPNIYNPNWTGMGRIEVYLLDELRNVAGKLTIRDRTTAKDGNHVEARAGDFQNNKFLINERGATIGTWANFSGILKLGRVGNVWTAYAAKVDSKGVHTSRKHVTWRDLDTRYTRKIKYVVVHMGGHDKTPLSPMAINDLHVYKVNPLASEEVPYIGEANDIFTVDMAKSLILKNGEPFMKKDFGSRFFHLRPGDNGIMVYPPEVIKTFDAEWRERYK